MRRAILLLVLVAAGAALWWKREDATRLAVAAVPSLAGILPGGAGKAPVQTAASRPPPPAVPVVVAAVEVKPLPLTIEAVGTIQAMASIQLKPRIDSQITAIHVAEGAKVKEGDLLVTLDPRTIQAQLAQAEATIVKDSAQLEQQRRDLARAEDLLAKRITSEVQRDTAATVVKVQEAQLAADQAQRENLKAALSYTEIRAPVSGRIGSIALKVGTTVKAGDVAIATVNQIDPILVSFAVPQSAFPSLRAALAAGPVQVRARSGKSVVTGQVAFVENAVDLATGTVLAKATMPNADEQLWPGGFVSVEALLGTQADAVAVPASAVQLGQQGAYVFTVGDDRKATLVNVTIARTVAGQSVVSAGLKGGEKVVIDGQLRLVNGAAVQVQQRSDAGVARGGDDPSATARRS